MYPDTRGRISTDSTGSSRPVNSSHSFTSFSTAVTTLTGNGGAPLFAGDLLQSTTIRDTAANHATVSSLFTMVRIVRVLKNANNSWLILFSNIVFLQTLRRDHRVVEPSPGLDSRRLGAKILSENARENAKFRRSHI